MQLHTQNMTASQQEIMAHEILNDTHLNQWISAIKHMFGSTWLDTKFDMMCAFMFVTKSDQTEYSDQEEYSFLHCA